MRNHVGNGSLPGLKRAGRSLYYFFKPDDDVAPPSIPTKVDHLGYDRGAEELIGEKYLPTTLGQTIHLKKGSTGLDLI
jgi:hypothetical protein